MTTTNNKKYYTYNISKFDGYRLKYEKTEIAKYNTKLKKIKGFSIYSSCGTIFNFIIDSQLIRKIKLKNLSNEIKFNSIDYYILKLIDKSEEVESRDDFMYNYTSYYYYSDKIIEDKYYDYEYKKEKLREMKANNYYQSKSNNQKIKQYNRK